MEYSTDVVVSGTQPHTLVRQLQAGVYLLEIRERDIDLRVGVEDGTVRTELADAFLRHGLHRTVVSLGAPTRLRITLASIDQRSWKGAAAVRILRWPKRAPDAPPDDRLLGFRALGDANSLIAQGNSEAWRAALAAMREATRRFQAANDLQALAETEYQRGWLERSLLFDFDGSRRTATAALGHFRAAGDPIGAQRAAVLLGLDEFSIAAGMGPEVPRAELSAGPESSNSPASTPPPGA